MADPQGPQDLENRVQLLYEALISETSFKAAEDRARQSATKTAQDTLKIQVDAENRRRTEAARIQAGMTRDDQTAVRNRINLDNRQRREAKQILDAMERDHKEHINRKLRADKQYADDRAKFDRERMQAQLYTPGQMAQFRSQADQLLAMLGPGGGGPPGPNGPRPGGGYRGGGGPGINPFLTSLGFAASSTGLPGSRLLGGLAIGGGFGGTLGFAGAAVGGGIVVALTAIAVAIKSIQDAMEQDSAERKYAATIRTIGLEAATSAGNLNKFQSSLASTRAEAITTATAFARASALIQTSPNDVAKFSLQALAKGQTPEELAKVIDALSKGNKEAFELETGLKANIVINEYARSLGKLPEEIDDVTKAQLLWNTYLQQTALYADLAGDRVQSAEFKWLSFKNKTSDLSAGFGSALIGALGITGANPVEGLSNIYGILTGQKSFSTRDFEPLLRTLGFDIPENVPRETPELKAAKAERERQRELDRRYQTVASEAERKFKVVGLERPGETQADRLRGLQQFREEFQGLLKDLDSADPRLHKFEDAINKGITQAAGQAQSQVESLRKSLVGSTSELAALQLPGVSNPYLKLLSESADAAERLYERFRILGPEVVGQYAQMQRAAIDAQVFQVRVQTQMKATALEFEAANLKKPFLELTGEMKRSLEVLRTEIGAAVSVPKLLAQANAIDLFARYRPPRANERAFGLFGVSEVSPTFIAQQQLDRLLKLRRQYSGGSDLGSREATHLLDQELINLFGSLPPALQARALRAPGARGPGGYADVFGKAFRSEATYAQDQIELAVQRAALGRQAAAQAELKLKQLQTFGGSNPAEQAAIRAEVLAVTSVLGRDELTPALLKGRIDALKEEAAFQRDSQLAAENAVKEAQALRSLLEEKLDEIEKGIKARNESVLLRVLDDSNRTKLETLGEGYQQ